MKLGYRDRIILLVVLVVVILAIGIFVFIKPQWKKLTENQKKLETAKTEWSETLQSFERINTMRETITKRRGEAYDISQVFTDEMDATQLDQFIQENFINIDKFKEDKVELVNNIAVGDEASTSLGYYYYTPSVVTYPLYEYADFDGSLAKATAEKLNESTVLGGRDAQNVGVGNATLTLKITREDTMALIDSVRAYAEEHKDAMLIQSISIKEYDFNGKPSEAGATPNPEAPATPAAGEEDNVTPGYTEVTFVYQVFYMQEPTEVKEAVGPAYDASVWDGNEWKSYGQG